MVTETVGLSITSSAVAPPWLAVTFFAAESHVTVASNIASICSTGTRTVLLTRTGATLCCTTLPFTFSITPEARLTGTAIKRVASNTVVTIIFHLLLNILVPPDEIISVCRITLLDHNILP